MLLLEIFHKIEKSGGQASLSVATVGGKTKLKLEIATTSVPPTESSSTSSPTGRHQAALAKAATSAPSCALHNAPAVN